MSASSRSRRRTQRRPLTAYSRAEVLEQIRSAARKFGDTLTALQFQEFSCISNGPILRLGGWRKLRVAAGLTDRVTGPRESHYNEPLIRQTAERLISEVGPNLTLMEFTRRSGIDAGTFRRHCGRWGAFRASLGLDRNPSGPGQLYSDLDLLKEYHRVFLKLGRLPKEREFARLSRTRYQQLRWRFGRWSQVKARLFEYLDEITEIARSLSANVEQQEAANRG